ncbi:MAG: hypothetical protein ACRYG7_06165 [Janthinobacterium lividum]
MKASEIIFRQNRVVYVLMVLLAAVGLTWAFWERMHRADEAAPAKHPTAASMPAAPTSDAR